MPGPTPSARRSPALLAACALVAAVAACDAWSLLPTRADPLYCDEQTPCRDGRMGCQLATRTCQSSTGDMGAPPDLAPPPCVTSATCPADTPVCEAGRCRACAGAADDTECLSHGAGSARCVPGGRCGPCRPDTMGRDCVGKTPVCDPTGFTCRACQRHAECPSEACLPDGACATPGTVAYVSGRGSAPIDCKGENIGNVLDGTPDHPYCDIQDAVSAGRVAIFVVGNGRPYNEIRVTKGTVYVLGPPPGTMPRAQMWSESGKGPVAEISGGGQLMMADMEVLYGTVGASCNGARLVLLRTSVRDSEVGVSAASCDLVLDGVRLVQHRSGGALVRASTYTITNTVAAGNGPVEGAFVLDPTSSGTFAFNTVVANSDDGRGAAGVACPAGMPRTITDSIFIDNGGPDVPGLGPGCVPSSVVVGSDPRYLGAGTVKGRPVFVDAMNRDYRLDPTAPASGDCCIDKIMAPPTPNADHDIDGNTRPRGAGWDLGAHEAR